MQLSLITCMRFLKMSQCLVPTVTIRSALDVRNRCRCGNHCCRTCGVSQLGSGRCWRQWLLQLGYLRCETGLRRIRTQLIKKKEQKPRPHWADCRIATQHGCVKQGRCSVLPESRVFCAAQAVTRGVGSVRCPPSHQRTNKFNFLIESLSTRPNSRFLGDSGLWH
jgi:hypothetical protein